MCAVSGGADSLAMLALAVAAGCSARAVHVDHGLRAGGPEEAAVVEAGANALGATFEALSVRVEQGPDLEARACRACYAVLPEGTMVGHTADDQAETLLLNLMRGAGLDGLRGMRANAAGLRKVRRPILALRRSETAALVTALGPQMVDDPSNAEARFRRNRARHEILPLLGMSQDATPSHCLPGPRRYWPMMPSCSTCLRATSTPQTPGPWLRRHGRWRAELCVCGSGRTKAPNATPRRPTTSKEPGLL